MTGEYYKTKESVEEYIKLANDVNGRHLIERLEQVLPHNAIVLEIGSGPGNDWKILNECYDVVGSDNSTEFLKYLFSKNPKGEFLELDAITLKTDKKFDGTYSNKVMHHLNDNDLMDSVKRQYGILNPKGIVCHSFWKGEGSEIFKGLFVNYHSEETLKRVFQHYFEILSIVDYKEFEDNDSILLIGKKK
ncbi:MAG: class I SAM-dependent methyltransferase [Maribacter sp.]|nr:class I SAM-dependent methyltransferase [Maribacter sp.]